jgi:GTP-binding protein Era
MADPLVHPETQLVPSGDFAAAVRRAGTLAWDTTGVEVDAALRGQLTLAFLGSASAGKDSAIRAVFGIDFGEISPIPGSTSALKVIPLDEAGQVLLVNAPGFGDVRADVDQVARKILDDMDVIVYVVNAEGGATIDERRDLDAIRSGYGGKPRPVLVCLNKIDLIRVKEREAFVVATLAQLGVDRKDCVVAAFDPLPQLAAAPIGVAEVTLWIHDQLAVSGKQLLFAKHLRNKAQACEPIILAAAKRASVAGAIPVPGADLVVVTAIQVKLIRDIAVVHGVEVDKDVALFIIGELLSGGMRSFVRWGAEALKAAGWIPGAQIAEAAILAVGAMVAGATTFGVGKAAIQYFQSGRSLDSSALRVVFDAAAWDWKRRGEAARG